MSPVWMRVKPRTTNNLNIPRYVDTFEEEEPVDIGAVVKDLKVLEVDMQETDKTIAGFCRKLGIESPFLIKK